MKKGKVLCVYSPKGGVGKSTISSNLAAASSIMNKKTLLIDADFYNGCLSLYVNDHVDKTIFNLCDDIRYLKYNGLKNYVKKYNDNLDILCAPKIEFEADFIKTKHLEKIIEESILIYDFIVIDTSPIYNELTEKLIRLSDQTLLVINNELNNITKCKNITNIFKIEKTNYKVLYNNSYDYKEEYLTHYDIMKMINANIDYSLGKESFIKDMTKYIINHYIPILYKDNDIKYYEFVDKLMMIIDNVD